MRSKGGMAIALRCIRGGLLLWPLLIIGARHAQAQDDSDSELAARAAFQEGRAAYDMGRFAEALSAYERAFELSKRPEMLFNIGRAAESDGKPARAVQAYQAYLGGLPQAENRAFVEARIAKLSSQEGSAFGEAPTKASTDASPITSPESTGSDGVPSINVSVENAKRPGDTVPARPLWRRGWFWGIVGGTVAAALVAGIMLSLDGAPKRVQADERIMTLVKE